MTDEQTTDPTAGHAFSLVLISLLRGVTYRDDDAQLWQSLLALQPRVREQMAPLGLELVLDEAEGHAYLRQRPPAQGEPELPRLVVRRPLSFPVSLLLTLLRRRLAEHDAQGTDTRLIVDRAQLAELFRVFVAGSGNEARLVDRIDAHVNKAVELGFLRRLRGHEDRLEVRRILKTFVDAQWLSDFEERLSAYRGQLSADPRRDADE
ncbi:MAG: DUF4194 domain-containing protein [Deltaproteobacteria bacterium]